MTDNESSEQNGFTQCYDFTELLQANEDEYLHDNVVIQNSDYVDPFDIPSMPMANNTSYFHINCRGISSNWNGFNELISHMHSDSFTFDFIGMSEVYKCQHDSRIRLNGYHEIITRTRESDFRVELDYSLRSQSSII